MKYRATIAGFIDRLIQPGDVVEFDGPPPILGLVPIDEPAAEPSTERPARSKKARAAPGDDEAADVI
jgi:hypothetical protein